jgi:hypothetical protein
MSIRAWTIPLSVGALLSLAGCLAPRAVDLEGKSCPCAEGWVCDTATDTCIHGSGGGGDGGVADTGGGGDTGATDGAPMDTGGMTDGAPMDTMMSGAVMIFIEAESGTVEAPMATMADGAASGGNYVASATGAADTATPAVADGRVRLSVDIPADGTYRVWGLAQTGPIDPTTMNNDPNSFWVCMDTDPPTAAGCTNWNSITGDGTYQWDDVHDAAAVDVAIDFTLTTGPHQLDVYTREANTRLDRVLVTDDLTLTAATIP